VKAGEGESRTLTFTISTSSVDRMGDTIAVSGWKLDAYRKNPVVLWGHDSADFPVAKTTKLWIEGEKLKAESEFIPKDNPATGPSCRRHPAALQRAASSRRRRSDSVR
jgi:hypothetical protein